MIKSKPEDTPKIIALAVAIIAVFAYVIYSFMRGTAASADAGGPVSASAPPAPSSNTLMGQPFASTDPTTMSPSGPSPDLAAQAESLLADNSVPSPVAGRDPFRSPVGSNAGGGRFGEQYEPQNIPQPRPNGTVNSTMVGNVVQPGSVPMPVDPPPANEVELKGVVSGGSRPMALLRIGDTVLTVYEGQKIAPDVTVKKIGIASIELVHQGTKIMLEVGTMLMASIHVPEALRSASASAPATPVAAGQPMDVPASAEPVYVAPPPNAGQTPYGPI